MSDVIVTPYKTCTIHTQCDMVSQIHPYLLIKQNMQQFSVSMHDDVKQDLAILLSASI